MSRGLFNDPEIGARVQRDFLPVSGSVERLQHERYGWPETDSSRWFRPMAERAMKEAGWQQFWEEFKTVQGLYVAGADGTPYGYTNVYQTTAKQLTEFFDRSLAAYRKHPPTQVEIEERLIREGAPDAADPLTSVVRVFSRIRGKPGYDGIGRDHLWIFRDEVDEILRAGEGASVPLPRAVIARIVRFHLLDHSRNVGVGYGEEDVRKAEFTMTPIQRTAGRKAFSFVGSYVAERHDEENDESVGIEGTMEGEIEIDPATRRIVRFRAVAEATAWGDVKRTGAPAGRYDLVIGMVEADDALARTVPPVWYGISPIWSPIYTKPTLALWKE